MYIKKYVNDFYELKENSWGGAVKVLERIEELDKENEFMNFLECSFGDEPIGELELNDFIWFQDEYIFEELEISWKNDEKMNK